MADLDSSTTAHPLRHAPLLPRESVIAELTVLPVHETSWP